MLTVEVCVAWPDRAWRIAVRVAAGATVGDALLAASCDPAVDDGVAALLTEAARTPPPEGQDVPADASGRQCDAVQPARKAARIGTGVFGKSRPLDWPLREGDRVEVYRPLTVDPKAARRRRAQARGEAGRAGRTGRHAGPIQ